MEKDPVCGMLVKTDEASGSTEYQGKHYFFCNVSCKDTFDRDPQRYVVKTLIERDTVGQVEES